MCVAATLLKNNNIKYPTALNAVTATAAWRLATAATAATLNLGFWMRSTGELGIATAAIVIRVFTSCLLVPCLR